MAFVFDELYYKTLGEMAEFLDSGQAEFITVCKRIHVYPYSVQSTDIVTKYELSLEYTQICNH